MVDARLEEIPRERRRVAARTPGHQYHALTRERFFANNCVKRFKTLVSMSRVKVGLEVPVEIAE
ncbi:hypothetical protein WS75_08980 [Burkholderia sp. FL-7-2-10-S1-D7]|nr:hypothetical protein WS75_08980 [Burkholderia sp. FL-7-2-10-S1-D7]